MASENIKPGDKIDIVLLHQKNDKVYKSSFYDFLSPTEIEIGMPTFGGKMVLFQVGLACQFFFYTQKGIYTCDMVIKERYKKGNLYMLSAKITGPLKKHQRRDYFRVDCSLDFYYYAVPKEVAQLPTTEEIFEVISDLEYMEKVRFAQSKDISGGGIRFMANEDIEVGSYVVSVIQLTNEKVDKTFYLVTEIIACDPIKELREKRMVRARFLYKEDKDREQVIRYVFEEDRCMRKKERT